MPAATARGRVQPGALPRDFLFFSKSLGWGCCVLFHAPWVQSSVLVTPGKTGGPHESRRLARLLSRVPQTLPMFQEETEGPRLTLHCQANGHGCS